MIEHLPDKPLFWIGSSLDDLKFCPDVMSDEHDIPVRAGSGNVFADFGRSDAEEALARVRLAQQIAAVIERKDLSQTEAAALMGLDQLKVSALMRGRLSGFSTDRLFRCLMSLGQDVNIVVRDKPEGHTAAHISVSGAQTARGDHVGA